MPQVRDTIAVIGFSLLDGYAASNSALLVAQLKPFAERTGPGNSAQALIAELAVAAQQIRVADVLPFNLPPVVGLSTTGGFQYQLEAIGGADPAAHGSVVQALVAAANQDPRLARVFSTYRANSPSLFLDIDRKKAQALGINISDVFTALQTTLGGYFINNFNLFGRVWQVNLQAEAGDRRDISETVEYLRPKRPGDNGAAAIDRNGSHGHGTPGHNPLQQLSFRGRERRSGARSGVRDGPGRHGGGVGKDLAARVRLRMDRHGFPGATGGGQTGIVLGLAVLFAFLFLVALYESWIIPIPVLLSVVAGVLGAHHAES